MSATKRGLIVLLLCVVIILLAGAARVTLALHNHRALYDEVLVMEMADQLTKGQGYTLEWVWFPALAHAQGAERAGDVWPQPDPQLMPLLPTLIAGTWSIVGQSVPVAAAVVALIASLCVLVAFLFGGRAGGLAAGAIGMAVVLVNAHYLRESTVSLTSAVYGLFLVLIFWAFYEAMRASRWHGIGLWALLGVIGGVAWLARPEGPLILPALGLTAAYGWWRRRKTGGGARWLIAGFVLAVVLFVVAASPLIAYNLANYGTPLHATGKVNQWSWDYDARFSVTPPTAEAYWEHRTLSDFVALKAENLAWMLTLLGDYLTWPVLALLLLAAGAAIWRASPLTAVAVYTLIYLTASLFQSPMSIWPGTQYFMYYSGILPAWAVLIGWGLRELWPILSATRARRFATMAVLVIGLAPVLVVEGAQAIGLVDEVGRSRTEVADPRLHDFEWMAGHIAPDAIVMTWDVENLHWYSDHRRAVMVPTDDARTIQAFMRRFGVTHFYYNDWLVGRRPALRPLRKALRNEAKPGPYSVLQPVYVGEGILFQVDLGGPPGLLLVAPGDAGRTEERIAGAWLRYAVTDTVPADLGAYPAVVASDATPGLADHIRQPVGARFGDRAGGGIELLAYEVSPVEPGETLYLTLYWRCAAPVEVDYTVFNHLLAPGAGGTRIAQQDGPPASGLYPTSWWQPGEVIVDRHAIDIPPDVPPGGYQLAVGLYEFATMERLTTQDGEDVVTLAPIVIGREP